MKITITFRDDEARSLRWILGLHYNNSKAMLPVLAKQAIRDIAAQYAGTHLTLAGADAPSVPESNQDSPADAPLDSARGG